MRKLLSFILVLVLAGSLPAQVKLGGTMKVGGTAKATVQVSGGGPFVSDTFTEPTDNNLQLHTGETGATWTLHPAYSGAIVDNATLDKIYLNTASAAAYYASGISGDADYCVKADFNRVTQISNNVALILAFDTALDTGILLRANDTGAAFQWEVLDRTGGSNGTPVTSASNQLAIGGAAITMEMCRSGTSVTVTAGGVQDTNLNFTTGITATARAGMRISGQASQTTGIHLDNFIAQ